MFSIFTAFPRGYCAWVHRAVGMLMEIVALHPWETIYVNHEIIHNTFVVKMFERKGVVFEPDLDAIPKASIVVISAHGTGPSYFAKLREKSMRWYDATCPLVEKVHREARDFIAKGYHILYIGKKWHQEALWVIDEGEKYFTLIEKEEDLDSFCHIDDRRYPALQDDESSKISPDGRNDGTWKTSLALLTQTTLSVDDTASLIEKIQERFPDIVLPKAGDICYATTNRQKAVKELANTCDIVLVVGSKNSSNSSKLRHVAEEMWKKAFLIDGREEIDPSWLHGVWSVGVTAWASGPEELVEWVIEALESLGGRFDRELRIVEEKMEFPYTIRIQN